MSQYIPAALTRAMSQMGWPRDFVNHHGYQCHTLGYTPTWSHNTLTLIWYTRRVTFHSKQEALDFLNDVDGVRTAWQKHSTQSDALFPASAYESAAQPASSVHDDPAFDYGDD
jgi:hypothetical protein